MIAVRHTYSKHDPCLGDLYYVIGTDEEDAIEHLRTQIKKYYFKLKLSQKGSDDVHRLGDRVLVSGFVSEEFASSKTALEATDVTAMAWVYMEERREGWDKFDAYIDIEDTVADA